MPTALVVELYSHIWYVRCETPHFLCRWWFIWGWGRFQLDNISSYFLGEWWGWGHIACLDKVGSNYEQQVAAVHCGGIGLRKVKNMQSLFQSEQRMTVDNKIRKEFDCKIHYQIWIMSMAYVVEARSKDLLNSLFQAKFHITFFY